MKDIIFPITYKSDEKGLKVAESQLSGFGTIAAGAFASIGAAAVDAYVDPLSGAALKQAIYNQTRIEFWGEGKSYLALKRNQATVTRGTNHVFRANQSFAYDIDEMSFQIPQLEMNNNSEITSQN